MALVLLLLCVLSPVQASVRSREEALRFANKERNAPSLVIPSEGDKFSHEGESLVLRAQREVKDRADALYALVAAPEVKLQETLADGRVDLFKELSKQAKSSRISTKREWKQQVKAHPSRVQEQGYLRNYVAGSRLLAELENLLYSGETEEVDEVSLFAPALEKDTSDYEVHLLMQPAYLPSHMTLIRVFPFLDPRWPYLVTNIPLEDRSTVARALSFADVPRRYITPQSFLYYATNRESRLCEVWTLEYIDALANYVITRALEYNNDTFVKDTCLNLPFVDANFASPVSQCRRNSIQILEIAAGDGRLTHFLERAVSVKLQQCALSLSVTFVASDLAPSSSGSVQPWDAQEALTHVPAQIVLLSWMPMGLDLSRTIRAFPSVLEYVLIGETDYGVSGTPVDTWGIGAGDDAFDDFAIVDDERLQLLRPWQIARSDSPL
ncbi:MAG: hypothetical protein MHM6MM_001911 [Cercozoa sp. M6MM]